MQEAIQIAVEDRICAKLYIYFDLVSDKIQQVHLSGGKILVYCRAGQSRSATLCIAYFMKYHHMAYEDAFQFVRQCRPIIHPNIGFIRQLKEFEVKLRARLSVPSLAIATTPAAPRKTTGAVRPLIPLTLPVVAACELIEENDCWEELEEVAIRPPKHRRSRYAIQEPFCEVAEQQEVAAVLLCLPVLQASQRADKSRPTAGLQEALPVASQGSPSLLLEQIGEQASSVSSKCRSAFSRLCRPAFSAVSYMNLALEIPASTLSPQSALRTQAVLCSPPADFLLLAPLILEMQPAECLGSLPAPVSPSAHLPCLSLPALPRPSLRNLRPPSRSPVPSPSTEEPGLQSAMVPLLTCATVFSPALMECSGVAAPQRTNKLPQRGLVRTMSVNVRSMPSHRFSQLRPLRPLNNNNSFGNKANQSKQDHLQPMRAEVRLAGTMLPCACTCSAAVVMESALPQQRLAGQQQKVRVVAKSRPAILAFLVTGLQCEGQEASDEGLKPDLSTRLASSLESLDSRKVATGHQVLLLAMEGQVSQSLTALSRPAKEFPYYSNVKHTSAVQLFRAKEEARLKTLWYRDTTTMSTATTNSSCKPIYMAKTVSQLRKESPRELVGLSWAANNYLEDKQDTLSPLLPMQWNREQAAQPASYACQVFQPAIFERTQLLGHFYVPHYNPALLRRDCDTPWKMVADAEMLLVLSMHNLYSAPRTCGLKATVSRVLPDTSCLLSVAVTYLPDLQHEEILEDIPDQIQDFNEIKLLLARNSNQTKCNIWFDVFKRTLIRLRPNYPCWDFVWTLPVAEVSCQMVLMDCPLTHLAGSTYEVSTSATCFLAVHPCNIATTCQYECTETCRTFTFIHEVKRRPKPFLRKLSLCYSLEVFIPQSCDVVRSYGGRVDLLNATKREYATSTVSFPNKLYSVAEPYVLGQVGPLEPSQRLLKTPFQRLGCLHGVASHLENLPICYTNNLPGYQFVQDVEDWPDRLVATIEAGEVAVASQVDTLWFFALDSVPCHGQPKQKNFLLFLPDPETVDRLGQEALHPEVGVVVDAGHLVAELIQEMRDSSSSQLSKAVQQQHDRREVAFQPENSIIRPSRQQKVKTIYYGRDRSKSRARLKDIPLARNASFRTSEAEVMRNLAQSVNESRDILARRRAATQYPASPAINRRDEDYLSPSLGRRGECSSREEPAVTSPRLSRREQEELVVADYASPRPARSQVARHDRYSQESYNTSRKLELESPASGGLYGILNLAQNLFKGSPTKERSPRPGVHRNRNY